MRNILIVGGHGALLNELVHKFHREEWLVYTLAANKSQKKPSKAFKQYVSHYDSPSIKEVIQSCRPNAIIFTGAYDSLYKWEEEDIEEKSLCYIKGLSNLLINSTMAGIEHFIYLSSEAVYEDDSTIDIREDMDTTPNTLRGLALSQGENIAMHFSRISQGGVTIARIANMYSIPLNRKACTDTLTKMCLEALTSNSLKVNAKNTISGLYVRDAVEALYLLINAAERKHTLYNISSMEEKTEGEIAHLIKKEFRHPIRILDRTLGIKQRKVLSNELFRQEFPFDVKNEFQDTLPRIITHMEKHKSHFLHNKERRKKSFKRQIISLLNKFFPFIEAVAFFIPLLFLNRFSMNNPYLSEINFFLLYVLLFALIHGRRQAIFTSLLSIAGYLLQRGEDMKQFELLIDINTYIWIIQIFTIGLSVGHLKDRFIAMEKDKDEGLDYLTNRLADITKINASNAEIKDYFTEKLVSSAESIGKIYDITSRLNDAEPGEVLFTALDVLSEIMNTEDIAIYLVSNKDYCRLVSTSSERASSLGKSIFMDSYSEIFDKLKNKRVYINTSLDTNMPMMASALFDEEDNMRIVILLWELSYHQMTLHQANLLTIAGALVYSAVVRDANYMEALAYHRFVPHTEILQETAFKEVLNIYEKAEAKGYATSSTFYVKADPKSLKDIGYRLKSLLRETDYLGVSSNNNLAVLLTNTNTDESLYVRKRLEAKNINTYLEEELLNP